MGIIQGTGIAGSIPRGEPFNPFGQRLYVPTGASIQDMVDVASAGDTIYLEPGEYNEDVVISTDRIGLIGTGARDSTRITGVALGTSTALTLDGVSDVGVYNINLEGRSGGSGLVMSGQIRRVQIAGCKMHGGDEAVLLSAAGGEQFADVRFEDCNFANSALGISVVYAGGDPGHRVFVRGSLFSKITTACIVENGATHDWNIYDNIFSTSDGTEPTEFLDLDTTGTTGMVAGNYFGTATNATGANLLVSGVEFIGNYTQAGTSVDVPQ